MNFDQKITFEQFLQELKENKIVSKDLGWNNIGVEGCKALCEVLKKNTSLKELTLKRNSIGVEGCKYLSEALKINTSLEKLNLDSNNLGNEGCKYLSEALKINTSLEELRLKNNNIGSQGCLYLCEALGTMSPKTTQIDNDNLLKIDVNSDNKNRSVELENFEQSLIYTPLKKLDISENNLGHEGCKYLSEVLKINHSLESLNLERNKIGVEGCKSLSEIFQINGSLQHLDLTTNNIGVEGCKYLSDALKINNSLKYLNLSGNSIGNEGCACLYDLLQMNFSLTELVVDNNTNYKNTLNSIQRKLESNKTLVTEINKKFPIHWEQILIEKPNIKVLVLETCLKNESTIPYGNFRELIVLDLRFNLLDFRFVKYLCEFLKWNHSLKFLNLQGCKSIGDKEGNELLKVLSFNLCLVECNLNGTSISNQIQDEIKSKLRKNFPLTQTLGKTSINRICLKYFDIAELVILNKMDEVNDLLRKNNFTIRDFQDILFIFCAFNQFELCEKILTEYTLDMNVKLEDGNTYLHFSTMRDNYEISKLLLKMGIDINLLNNEKFYARDLCIPNGKCRSLFDDIKQLKVVILGKAEVGKTTLVKKILKHKDSFFYGVFANDIRTDGIDMYEWHTGLNKFDSSGNNIIQLWDFGGQELFYTTHQFFLSKNSIHLLLFKLSDEFMEKELFFWLNSIQYRAPKSKVIVIGTRLDRIEPKLIKEGVTKISNKIKNIYDKIISNIPEKFINDKIEIIPCTQWENPNLKETYSSEKLWFHPISGTEGWNIKYLEELIRKFSFNTVVRKEFIELKNRITSARKEKQNQLKYPLLLRKDLASMILDQFNNKEEEIERNIRLLHELGFILDFEMKYIIIDPQWLSNVFKSVVSLKTKDQIDADGFITRSQIFSNLKRNIKVKEAPIMNVTDISKALIELEEANNTFTFDDIDNLEFLVELMEKFQICIPLKRIGRSNLQMIIPCLLNTKKPDSVEEKFQLSPLSPNPPQKIGENKVIDENKEILGRKYTFPFIPRGVFENIFGKLCSFLGSNIKFWRNGFYITANENKGYLMFEIKLPESQMQNTDTPKFDHLYKGSLIEIKSIGSLNHYLISAFHFCIKELFQRDFPLLWENVKIEIEYNYKEDKYNNSLEKCLALWRNKIDTKNEKAEIIKTPNGLIIPWKKLIPEEYDKNINNVPVVDKLIVNITKFIPAYKIGEGRCGEVYVCKSLDESGLYAIKIFKIMEPLDKNKKRKSIIDPNINDVKKLKIIRSFEIELEIMRNLEHPNLTKLIGFDQQGDNWILVFPLYDSSIEDLHKQIYNKLLQPKGLTKFPLEDKYVQENYWWTTEQIFFMYEGILQGLEYLHSKIIAHFDLKAENILVNLNNEGNHHALERFDLKSIHIHDFGTAYQLTNENEKLSKYIGSPLQMAPEVRLWNPDQRTQKIEEKKQNKVPTDYSPLKADIFSFGILLCEIVGNTPRLYHTNTLGKLKDHKFEKVILDCLKEDPNERPTAKQLLYYFKDPNSN